MSCQFNFLSFIHIANFFLVGLVDLLNLLEIRVIFELLRRALCNNLSFFHDDNLVSKVHEIDGVSHKDSSRVLQDALEDLIKDLLASSSIKS